MSKFEFDDKEFNAQFELAEDAADIVAKELKTKLKRLKKNVRPSQSIIDGIYCDDIAAGFSKYSFDVRCYDEDSGRDFSMYVVRGKFFYEEYYDYGYEDKKNQGSEYMPKDRKEALERIQEQLDEDIMNIVDDFKDYCYF